MKYSDYSSLSPRFAEQIAHSRALEESRRVFGFPLSLTEDGVISAAIAELVAASAPVFNSASFSVPTDGETAGRDALNALVNTTMQPGGGVLNLVGVVRVESNMTFPTNVVLNPIGGGYLKLDAGVTVSNVTLLSSHNARAFDTSISYGSTFVTLSDAVWMSRPEWWGAVGDDTTDDSGALIAAFTASSRCICQLGPRAYLALQPVQPYGWVRGVNTRNPGTYEGASVIHGKHTGDAVLNLFALHGRVIESVTIIGDATTSPRTGLLLGRTDASSSAGNHRLVDINIAGSFSKTGYYSVASEDNYIENLTVDVTGGGALYGVAIAEKHVFTGFDSALGAASNMGNHFTSLRSKVNTDSASAAGLLISHTDATGPTGHIVFDYPFISSEHGAYIQIDVPGTSDIDGPITFNGGYGEGGSPTTNIPVGLKITGAAGRVINGLEVRGMRQSLPAGTQFVSQSANVTLKGGEIKVPAFNPPVTSTIQLDKLEHMAIDLGGIGNKFQSTILSGSLEAATIGAGVTTYAAIGDPTFNATEALRGVIMPRAGVVRNLYIYLGSAQPASGSLVVTLRKNGVATALTVTIPAGSPSAPYSDTAHYVSVVAGDVLSWQFVNNATGASGSIGSAGVTIDLQVAA